MTNSCQAVLALSTPYLKVHGYIGVVVLEVAVVAVLEIVVVVDILV